MEVNDIIWMEQVVDKIESKHNVSPEEIEEVFYNNPRCRKAQRRKFRGEDLYYAYGQTDNGRYLFVAFIYQRAKDALVISALDMDYEM